MLKIYIAGPISNIKNYLEKFEDAKNKLKNAIPNCEVINPAKLSEVMPNSTHSEYLKICYRLIDMSDIVVLLPDWKKSVGAGRERIYAMGKGKPIFELERMDSLINYIEDEELRLDMNITHEYADKSDHDSKYVIVDMKIDDTYAARASVYVNDSDGVCESELKITSDNSFAHIKHDSYKKAGGAVMRGKRTPIELIHACVDRAMIVLHANNNSDLVPMLKELI